MKSEPLRISNPQRQHLEQRKEAARHVCTCGLQRLQRHAVRSHPVGFDTSLPRGPATTPGWKNEAAALNAHRATKSPARPAPSLHSPVGRPQAGWGGLGVVVFVPASGPEHTSPPRPGRWPIVAHFAPPLPSGAGGTGYLTSHHDAARCSPSPPVQCSLGPSHVSRVRAGTAGRALD